jgi:hypothetical protein
MSKKETNEAKNYREQEEAVMQRSKDFIELLAKRGFLEDTRIKDEQIRKAVKTKKRVMYHNTKLLLERYRDITWMLECFPSNLAAELDQPLYDLDSLLSAVSAEVGMDNQKLEGRLESVKKSRMLIDRFNEALTVLKKKPGDGDVMYKVLYLSYIVPEKLTHEEILYRLGICSRHYYRLRKDAINILAMRLWSTPASEMDALIEILAIFESA